MLISVWVYLDNISSSIFFNPRDSDIIFRLAKLNPILAFICHLVNFTEILSVVEFSKKSRERYLKSLIDVKEISAGTNSGGISKIIAFRLTSLLKLRPASYRDNPSTQLPDPPVKYTTKPSRINAFRQLPNLCSTKAKILPRALMIINLCALQMGMRSHCGPWRSM